jgi:hypothetical protein
MAELVQIAQKTDKKAQLRVRLAAFNPNETPCGVQHRLGGDCNRTDSHFWCLHGPLVMILCSAANQLRTRLGEQQFDADIQVLQSVEQLATSADTRAHSVHLGRHFYPTKDEALLAAHADAEQGNSHEVATAYSTDQQIQTLTPLIEMRERYLVLLRK